MGQNAAKEEGAVGGERVLQEIAGSMVAEDPCARSAIALSRSTKAAEVRGRY